MMTEIGEYHFGYFAGLFWREVAVVGATERGREGVECLEEEEII